MWWRFCSFEDLIPQFMLQIQIVRERREKVIQGLKKRRLKDAEVLVDKALSLDQKRRDTQKLNDEVLSESNLLAKEIGNLMKSGQKEKAEEVKSRTSELKKTSANLTAVLSAVEEELQQVLYLIPNVPAEEVPEGGGPGDNLTVHSHGALPALPADAVPHWDLIKNTTSLILIWAPK